MGRLPPEADQAWLMNELARLVAAGGDRQLVRAPIRRPTSEDFPDPWTGDVGSLHRLCRRLMRYAGIGKLDVRIEVLDLQKALDGVDHGQVQWRLEGRSGQRAATWFAGIDDGVARFGCADRGLEEGGEELIGIVAHEVTRAWRTVHGLVDRDRDREELLTELTTVYLGFGLFAVNNAHRNRTFADGVRSGGRQSRAGCLPAEHLAFVLAAQILARRTSCLDAWRLLRLLEPNQRADARAALRRLRPAEEVRRRLGLTLLDDPPPIDFLRADHRPPVD